MDKNKDLEKLMEEIRKSQSRGKKLPDPKEILDKASKNLYKKDSKRLPDPGKLIDEIRKSQSSSYSGESPEDNIENEIKQKVHYKKKDLIKLYNTLEKDLMGLKEIILKNKQPDGNLIIDKSLKAELEKISKKLGLDMNHITYVTNALYGSGDVPSNDLEQLASNTAQRSNIQTPLPTNVYQPHYTAENDLVEIKTI